MSEQDRINANEYHYSNYKRILKALDNKDEAEARAICTREMNIIDKDISIEEYEDIEEKGKIIELADLENPTSSEEYK
jgi:DNA-binding GntR family transcriptional regulator|nr:MAG TPA: hypothetical protein [Caudoviricetes sp.]